MELAILGELLSEYVAGIAIVNEEGVIIWSNNLLNEISNKEYILGKKFSDITSIEIDFILNDKKTIKSDKGNVYAFKARHIKEYKIYIVYIEDITDFNNKDIKLYCLEKIINSINDGVIISDYAGRIVLYNKSQENLEELLSKDVVGKYLWEAYRYDPNHDFDLAEHRNVYKTREPIIEKYRAHVYNNGIPKYVSYSTYPIIKDNETIAVYSISKNETNLKELLSETIELKRKLFSTTGKDKKREYKNNGTTYTFEDIVGESYLTKKAIKESQTVALLNNTVLIVGETGTGKEIFAQSIHNFGKNSEEPFVAINCAAIPENLLESTLFGTIKGAYTGAVTQTGLFEDAKNGTLFLDELNSMPISMQSKLLRVLQERVVRRVGGSDIIPVKCRIISAVNEDPHRLIKEGRLRQDLFYRIAGLCICIPSLQERKEDIIVIGEFLIKKYNKMLNKRVITFSKELREVMFNYTWPGNIRELEHFVENIMVRANENQRELTIENIPLYIKNIMTNEIAVSKIKKDNESLTDVLKSVEKKIILDTLEKNNWNISQSSKDLGIIRQSLDYRMKKLHIKNKKK